MEPSRSKLKKPGIHRHIITFPSGATSPARPQPSAFTTSPRPEYQIGSHDAQACCKPTQIGRQRADGGGGRRRGRRGGTRPPLTAVCPLCDELDPRTYLPVPQALDSILADTGNQAHQNCLSDPDEFNDGPSEEEQEKEPASNVATSLPVSSQTQSNLPLNHSTTDLHRFSITKP
ncbi:hypothetical protein B0T18DRAFT_387559 [Schizothecium vesticola]|uniref:Uncharacterized protein n=1 Tax=Schizothecium vesticola TaxID=314040 RepID=A0AA40F5N9_9PEZI|nr:hypothetical protein B0T18DRAFT_387559 [Schizothecium vesticola]